jgi:lipoprotein-releasing system permease protein
MFYPLSIFVGLRYVRTRRRGFFVSFISWVSMLGVALGVAALITIVSVMNGFEGELRGRLVALTAHATVEAAPGRLDDWQATAGILRGVPGTVGVAPYTDVQAMVGRSGNLLPVLLHGMEPVAERSVADIDTHLVAGSLDSLEAGSRNLVLGRVLAWRLGVDLGDELTVMVPGRDLLAGGRLPALRTFRITGIFEVGLQDHDGSLALISLGDAEQLAGQGPAPQGLRLRYDDVMAAPARAAAGQQALGPEFEVSDWTQQHSAYFRAIRIEKTMMGLILMLVVAVAAFNIVAALVMVVNEKRSDIAILRTLGMAPRSVVGVFLTQGLVIGLVGTVSGTLLGILVASHVTEIVPVLERVFGFHVMDPSVYYITEIPSELRAGQIAFISLVAFTLTALATVYPALRGAATEPAEALRYE